MQFAVTKNSGLGGVPMSPMRRQKSLKSLEKVMEGSPRAHRRTHSLKLSPPKTPTIREYDEIIENETDPMNPHSRRNQHSADTGSAEPLAEIREMIEAGIEGQLYSLEDGRETKLEFQKFQTLEMSTTLVAAIGAILTVLVYDIEFDERDSELAVILLWFIFLSTLLAIFLNLLRYVQKLKFLKARNLLAPKETLFSTGEIKNYLLETVILLLQPYPFLREIKIHGYDAFTGINYYYYLNDIFSLLLVSRIYLLGRLILNFLIISDMYGAESGYMYACRCIMKMSSTKAVPAILISSIILFGYMIRICERPLSRDSATTMEFSTYWNSMWCVILTMTTVGYGDVYARTMLGRTISLMMCMWGIFVVSLMVVTLTGILTMSSPEEKSLMVLRRLELRKEVKKQAAHVLTNIAQIGLTRKKKMSIEMKNKKTKEIIKNLKHHLVAFKLASREVRSIEDEAGQMEEINRQIGFLRDDIKTMMESQTDLQRVVEQFMSTQKASRHESKVFVSETRGNFNTEIEEGVVIRLAKETLYNQKG